MMFAECNIIRQTVAVLWGRHRLHLSRMQSYRFFLLTFKEHLTHHLLRVQWKEHDTCFLHCLLRGKDLFQHSFFHVWTLT